MQQDNLYPNTGSEWYDRQARQGQTDPTEKAVNEKRDIIEEVVKWFSEEMQKFDSVDNIQHSPDTNPQDFMNAWAINRGMKAQFKKKKEELQALLEDYPAK